MITQERAKNLEAQVQAQAKRIAELAEFSRMASKAILLREKLLLKQSSALKLAREALDQIDWDIRNGGYADGFPETWARMDKALVAINEVLKGE